MQVPVQIVLQQPPAQVVYALQKGSGPQYDTEQKQTSALNSNLIFSFGIEVKGDEKADAQPDFKGPYVQGPKNERFIYVNIGTYAGHAQSEWGRRLKVPLRDINWAMVNNAVADNVLQTIVPGTAKDGTPNCATVKPFDGWRVISK